MIIGILKESGDEHRVALLPEDVEKLTKAGNKILIEKEAGKFAFAEDFMYKEKGGEVLSKNDVITKSEVLIKIGLPLQEEINELKSCSVFVGFIQPVFNISLVQKLASKKISVFSLDIIPRTTRAQSMDILSSMATLAGYKAVLLAATHLPRFFPMLTMAASTVKPSRILILGAGVAGLQAIATARRLGGVVSVFDTRPEVKEQVESLGGKFISVGGEQDVSKAGGYAVEQTEDYKQKQKQLIHDNVIKSDVVITTAQIPGKKAPLLISKNMIENMRLGSVIVDLAAASGGNCECSENNKTISYKGITIIGNSNLPNTMPEDASRIYGKNVINFLKLLTKETKLDLNFKDDLVKGTCVTHNGEILHEPTLKKLQETAQPVKS